MCGFSVDFIMEKLRIFIRANATALIVSGAFSLSYIANAQGRPAKTGWEVSIGGGALVSPSYPGDDSYQLSALPYIGITYSEDVEFTVQNGLRYTALKSENFEFGPVAKIAFGRDEDGNGPFRVAGNASTDLIGLGDIDTTIEIGGFAKASFGDWSLTADLGQAISGHDGLVGSAALNYNHKTRLSSRWLLLNFGPQINFGDADYQNAFFGITAAQSTASGLAKYKAGGGIVSYGLSANAVFFAGEDITLTALAGYDRLQNDAANSPLVTQRGSKDQARFGVFLAKTF